MSSTAVRRAPAPSVRGDEESEPTHLPAGRPGPSKPACALTCRDIFDEARRRLALKGYAWD